MEKTVPEWTEWPSPMAPGQTPNPGLASTIGCNLAPRPPPDPHPLNSSSFKSEGPHYPSGGEEYYFSPQ